MTIIPKKPLIEPYVLGTAGVITFILSWVFLLIGICVVFYNRNKTQFLYRSPTLIMMTFTAALFCQLLSGFSVLFHDPKCHITCTLGHVAQYVLYPIFFLWYFSRCLRLIVLFKRAQVGNLFLEQFDVDGHKSASTIAIINTYSRDDTSEISQIEHRSRSTLLQAYKESIVHKPYTLNSWGRIYYWFLFKFQSELSYFFLSLFFAILPVSLFLYWVVNNIMSRLPVVSYSHWVIAQVLDNEPLKMIPYNAYLGVLYDILIRVLDWTIACTFLILLLPIRRDFNIINELKLFLLLVFASSFIRNSLEVFYPSEKYHSITISDSINFYIQTIVYWVALWISVVYPFMIRKQFILPLPTSPVVLDNLNTVLMEDRCFVSFYDWLEEKHPNAVKYMNWYWRIRFYKSNFDPEQKNVTKDHRRAVEIAKEITRTHINPQSDEYVTHDDQLTSS